MPAARGSKTISVVVLAYNEEARIRPCLESVRWADQIVVVDGFSTDNTVAIAREYTVDVYVSDLLGPNNPGGFADQRNFAIEKSTGDWIFFIDADERSTPELEQGIRARILSDIDEGHSVYRVKRLEHFFGVPSPYTHGDSWHDRIIRRGAGRYDGRRVHETLKFEGTRGEVEGLLLHYSKDSVAHYVETMNRYTTLEAEEMKAAGKPLASSPWPAMIHAFMYRYWYLRSYREGVFGLLMCLMLTFYQYLTWAKYWELCKNAGDVAGVTRAPAGARVAGYTVSSIWRGFGQLKRWSLAFARPKR